MALTAPAMRRYRRQLDRGQFDQVHDALGDVDGLIADALQIGVDLGYRENKAQVNGGGLLRGEDVEGHLVDFALGSVDEALVFENSWQRVRSRSVYAWVARSTASSARPPMRSSRSRRSSICC